MLNILGRNKGDNLGGAARNHINVLLEDVTHLLELVALVKPVQAPSRSQQL